MPVFSPTATGGDAQALAESVRSFMLADDQASRALGMQVVKIGPGSATVTMAVRNDMLNGFAICHGGLMTTLADSAFAFACNSRNDLTVAAGQRDFKRFGGQQVAFMGRPHRRLRRCHQPAGRHPGRGVSRPLLPHEGPPGPAPEQHGFPGKSRNTLIRRRETRPCP
jgi:acyl-coenzyme A thioesterase PaaI-like protein